MHTSTLTFSTHFLGCQPTFNEKGSPLFPITLLKAKEPSSERIKEERQCQIKSFIRIHFCSEKFLNVAFLKTVVFFTEVKADD